VEVSMYAHEGVQVGDLQVGHSVDGASFFPDEVVPRKVTYVKHSLQPCYRLVTESDIEVVLSDSTPMPLRNGGSTKAPQMLGKEVLVDDHGVIRWERVKKLELLGMRMVALLRMDEQCYFAGTDPHRRVATHTPHAYFSAHPKFRPAVVLAPMLEAK
jgi:hypothetical protein